MGLEESCSMTTSEWVTMVVMQSALITLLIVLSLYVWWQTNKRTENLYNFNLAQGNAGMQKSGMTDSLIEQPLYASGSNVGSSVYSS